MAITPELEIPEYEDPDPVNPTDWTFRTLVITAAAAPQARALATSLSPAAGGMWATGLSATGAEPATHYISSGLVELQFAQLLSSPEAMLYGITAMGGTTTLAACTALLAQADVSKQSGVRVMARLNLVMTSTTP